MSKPYVWLFDDLALVLPEVNTAINMDKKKVDFTFDSYRRGAKGKVKLDVTFKASHSGRVTNNRCYPGLMMMGSMHTWTSPYNKPIVSRHPSFSMFGGGSPEPVVYGRVYDSAYNRIVADDLAFRNDWKMPDPHGEGSGYAQLRALITDEEAIERILDRRILTLSTGQRASSLRCNICGHDWIAKRKPCDHMPGQTCGIDQEDGSTLKVKAYHITGHLTYDHCAAVNSPADPHAVITGVSMVEDGSDFEQLFKQINSGPQDSMQATIAALALVDERGPINLCLTDESIKDVKDKTVIVASFELPTTPHPEPDRVAADTEPKDSGDKEEKVMGDPDKGDKPVEEPKDKPAEDKPVEEPKAPEGEEPKDAGTPATEDNPSGGDNDPDETPSDDLVSDGNILGSILEAGIEIDWVSMEAETGITEGEARKRIELADKVLTTTARKKLSASVFCGPDRSFPVNDCSHAANAKSRLVHAKLSSAQKAKVLSCINRRANAMGCFKSSKKKGDDNMPDITGDGLKEAKQEGAKLKQQVENLKASLTAKTHEIRTVLDALAEGEEKYRRLIAQNIIEAKRVLKKPRSTFENDEKYDEALDALAARPIEYLDGAYEDLKEELGAIAPERGSIEDPTLRTEGAADKKEAGVKTKNPEDEEVEDFLHGTYRK